ncbi:ATP F0F1 synthase synthase [Shewanella xiamenensis]|uniref:ATP F0F1 synthase synthase n=1 Tax=Shewanella xiamenensis TaxID=332186 RepID=UPI001C4E1B82|nr:ATP F0F1 synthase synthase [Shewanella xiamenensis]MBW0279920.1 ATP F0F1 synthase synthase [Shewanella xiamenensis]MBW0296581.1 ATP F0F1 synthase synthase [Shewanella xiamenensis]MCT8873383.1 ATP F0F1 synthase synthase [Shewanella xiamenensis]UWH42536.1 ATP F0F1 synthase synthase [Shewanella xiamenensis]
MDHILAHIKTRAKKRIFKLVSDQSLFDLVTVDLTACVPYNPDHNLDEDTWFKIEGFSNQAYCIDLLKKDYDSKDYDDLTKENFSNIGYLFAVQGEDFYFQKITPSLFVKRKTLVFGEAATLEQSQTRLVINALPDALYFKAADTLIFKSLATISSIFKGIDELYKEATKEEVEQFLDKSFIELSNDYNVETVSKPNRKRIGLAMATLEAMSDDDKTNMLDYIDGYCGEQKLRFDKENQKFEISNDDELKLLLYGIEQRFYTTPFGHEKRLANSVTAMG